MMSRNNIIVVGAGPAGVRAAQRLAQAGVKVVLVDEAPRVGGQIYRQPPPGAERDPEDLYGSEASKAVAIHNCLKGFGDLIDYRPATLVWNIFKENVYLKSASGEEKIPYDRLLLATGAFDRVIPVPGWTLLGVFTLGAAQIALKAQGVAIGNQVALIGAGPLLPLVASQYLKAGAEVAAVIDVTPFSAKVAAFWNMLAKPEIVFRGLKYLNEIRKHKVPVVYGARDLKIEGEHNVTAVAWVSPGGKPQRVECDAVGVSFGLRSETQLADLAGCEFEFDAVLRQWLPKKFSRGRTTQEAVYVAGDCAGIGGADVAELQGELAAYAILEDLAVSYNEARLLYVEKELRQYGRFRVGMERAYPFPEHLLDSIPDDEMICRCEGIKLGSLKEVNMRASPHDVNRQKAFSRVGLGRCQGRVCGMAAAEILSRLSGTPIESAGRLRGQLPVKPIAFDGS